MIGEFDQNCPKKVEGLGFNSKEKMDSLFHMNIYLYIFFIFQILFRLFLFKIKLNNKINCRLLELNSKTNFLILRITKFKQYYYRHFASNYFY